MNNLFKIDQEYCVDDSLVTIILEPVFYGIEDVRAQRDLVIGKLMDMANYQAERTFSSEQVAEVYDRIMAGDLEQTLRDFFTRNLAIYLHVCTTLYYWTQDITHQWCLHCCRTKSNDAAQTDQNMTRPRELFEDVVEKLEEAMLGLKNLSKLFTDANKRKRNSRL